MSGMGGRTNLNADQIRRQGAKELQYLPSPDLAQDRYCQLDAEETT